MIVLLGLCTERRTDGEWRALLEFQRPSFLKKSDGKNSPLRLDHVHNHRPQWDCRDREIIIFGIALIIENH